MNTTTESVKGFDARCQARVQSLCGANFPRYPTLDPHRGGLLEGSPRRTFARKSNVDRLEN
jgi:hypothetical protein